MTLMAAHSQGFVALCPIAGVKFKFVKYFKKMAARNRHIKPSIPAYMHVCKGNTRATRAQRHVTGKEVLG